VPKEKPESDPDMGYPFTYCVNRQAASNPHLATFSCDIARAVSRSGLRAERHDSQEYRPLSINGLTLPPLRVAA
jgi:hypothetical protein